MTSRPDDLADRALKLLRRARDQHGWHEESLCTDYARKVLVADGCDEATARRAVQKAWDDHFRMWSPV